MEVRLAEVCRISFDLFETHFFEGFLDDRLQTQFLSGFAVLQIAEAQLSDAGLYVFRAINDAGEAETAATIVVLRKLFFSFKKHRFESFLGSNRAVTHFFRIGFDQIEGFLIDFEFFYWISIKKGKYRDNHENYLGFLDC